MHWRRKWQPLQCSCQENPRDRGAWWAAVYGVAQSWTQLKRLSSSSIFTVPGGDWGPSPVLRKIWYKGASESPACYQLINAGEVRALSLVPTACPGNYLHIVRLGTVITHRRTVNITGPVAKTGAGREELASTFYHSKKSNAALWCLGRKTLLTGFLRPSVITAVQANKQAGPSHPSQWGGMGTWVLLY